VALITGSENHRWLLLDPPVEMAQEAASYAKKHDLRDHRLRLYSHGISPHQTGRASARQFLACQVECVDSFAEAFRMMPLGRKSKAKNQKMKKRVSLLPFAFLLLPYPKGSRLKGGPSEGVTDGTSWNLAHPNAQGWRNVAVLCYGCYLRSRQGQRPKAGEVRIAACRVATLGMLQTRFFHL